MHRLRQITQHLSSKNSNSEHFNASTNCTSTEVVWLGSKRKVIGSDIGFLADLNALTNADEIRQEFWSNGYGLFRGAIDRDLVLNARDTILRRVQERHNIFANVSNGILRKDVEQKDLPFLEGKNDITHDENILNVLENEGIRKITSMLLECESTKSFDYKWLRLVAKGNNTGVHVDNVYMSRGSDRLLTCWIPLMDIRMQLGTVFVLDGSYSSPSFHRFQQTYGSMDAEAIHLNGTGHFTQDPDDMKQFYRDAQDYQLRWKSCDFKAGDVLIFTMRTVHMSSRNESEENQVRMSCDTRWLPSDHQADDRFMYNEKTKTMGHATNVKFGLHNTDNKTSVKRNEVTMEQLRQKWRI